MGAKDGFNYYNNLETTWGAFARGCVGEGFEKLYSSARKILTQYTVHKEDIKICLQTSVKKQDSHFYKELNQDLLLDLEERLSEEGFEIRLWNYMYD